MPDCNTPQSPVRGRGEELAFNVLLLGAPSVGKSTLSNHFVNGFSRTTENYAPTIGIDFYFKKLFIDGYNVKLQFWDTAGQGKFMTHLNESYFHRSNCVILMYDIFNKESFKEIKLWTQHVNRLCQGVEKIIVANKCDLNGERQVSESDGKVVADKFGFEFAEISSVDPLKVDRLLKSMTRAMILSHLRQQSRQDVPTSKAGRILKALTPPSFFTPKSKAPTEKQAFRDQFGEADVGKTSLMCRYVRNQFTSRYRATVGIDFEAHIIQVDDKKVKLQIWDTAGQEKFKSLSPQYYRGADAAVVVYDVSSRHSFDRVLSWVSGVEMQNSTETVIAIVGNKCDLNPKTREVEKRLGMQVSQSLNADIFMETSAKACVNVAELFEALARKIMDKKIAALESPGKDSSTGSLFQLEPSLDAGEPPKKRSCCSS